MIVAYSFFPGDQDLALKNAQWMNELGGCKGHEVMVCYDARCTSDIVEAVGQEMLKAFDKVYRYIAKAAIDGWPEGANYFFRTVTAWMQNNPRYRYFLWLEPDAIPMREGWLNDLEKEFLASGKPFMGDRVQVEDIPLHMSGVGIYPNPLHQWAGEAYRAHDEAWDMSGKDQIVPQAHFTKLIEHAWRHPVFTNRNELKTQIRPEAVIFHSSKDGSLIDLLRHEKNLLKVQNGTTIRSVPISDQERSPVLASMPDMQQQSQGTMAQTNKELSKTQDGTGQSGEASVGVGNQSEKGSSPGHLPEVRITETGGTPPRHPQTTGGDVAVSPMSHSGTSSSIICDIFIRTYKGDYAWLNYCLQSIQKFCTGFRKVWVVSPDQMNVNMIPDWVEWKVMNDETEDGYLAQQITKLYADVITDYQSDYILHVDSDVIFTRECMPQDFFALTDLKLIWYYTRYSEIETPWQPITSKFMGETVPYEFMRRFPIMVPRWLYPRLREFCHKLHGMIISDYIRTQPPRAFSEFNALGAYAYKNHRDMLHFVNTLETEMPTPVARQFFSWGGITSDVKAEIETILHGTEQAKPKPSGGPTTTPPADLSVPLQSSGIKVLPNGIWVVNGDTHVSKWVEQQQRLDHDQNTLPFILPLIKEGQTVIDIGAFIGDHTIAYAKAVGPKGMVYAFEPNPVAFQCLKHNLRDFRNVWCENHGLSDRREIVPLSGNNGNTAGAYVGAHMKIADVKMEPLDDAIPWGANLIKIDAEGYEVKILKGAKDVIECYHPILVIEVNPVALLRQGETVKTLLGYVEAYGYSFSIMQENCNQDSDMYDIVCLPPVGRDEVVEVVEAEVTGSDGIIAPLEASLSIHDHVKALADYAQDKEQIKYVRKLLRKYGVIPKPRRK
jgi:FkbM family methyltransferase